MRDDPPYVLAVVYRLRNTQFDQSPWDYLRAEQLRRLSRGLYTTASTYGGSSLNVRAAFGSIDVDFVN